MKSYYEFAYVRLLGIFICYNFQDCKYPFHKLNKIKIKYICLINQTS